MADPLALDYANVTMLLGTVVGVNSIGRHVLLEDGTAISFDTLVLATGARHDYFGHHKWEPFAPGLKTIEDATAIRRRVLLAFEEAARTLDAAQRAKELTFVIIGGGPTGVELAGTLAELARDTLRKDFRAFDTRNTRVVLVEQEPVSFRASAKVCPAMRFGH